jgi:hypothetical protein
VHPVVDALHAGLEREAMLDRSYLLGRGELSAQADHPVVHVDHDLRGVDRHRRQHLLEMIRDAAVIHGMEDAGTASSRLHPFELAFAIARTTCRARTEAPRARTCLGEAARPSCSTELWIAEVRRCSARCERQ